MCAQCAQTGVIAAAATATGARAWLAVRAPRWLTPRRLRVVSAVAIATGVVGAGAAAG